MISLKLKVGTCELMVLEVFRSLRPVRIRNETSSGGIPGMKKKARPTILIVCHGQMKNEDNQNKHARILLQQSGGVIPWTKT